MGRLLAFACLSVVGVQAAGCATIAEHILDQRYYLVEPSIVSLPQGAVPNPCIGGGKAADFKRASDKAVIVYADCVKKMLRRRMNLARIARLTSASFATLTAAAAAALGATASAPLSAITALAATSAVLPEFSRIFGADERARAYDEGVSLIGEAEGRYLVARAEVTSKHSSKEQISDKELSLDGARFYVEIVASLKLVEQLLVAQLPKIEDIQRARGQVAAEIASIDVLPRTVQIVQLGNEGAQRVSVLRGARVTRTTSSNSGIAYVEPGSLGEDGSRSVPIVGKSPGEATITLSTAGGAHAEVKAVVSPTRLSARWQPPATLDFTRGPARFKLIVKNDGPSKASGVRVETTIEPTDTTTSWNVTAAGNASWSCLTGTSAAAPTRTVVCTAAALDRDEREAELPFDLWVADEGAELKFTAKITMNEPLPRPDSGAAAEPLAEPSMIITALADLGLTATSDKESVKVGEKVSITVRLRSLGPAVARDVTLRANKPLTPQKEAPCTHVADPSAFICRFASLPVGEQTLALDVPVAREAGEDAITFTLASVTRSRESKANRVEKRVTVMVTPDVTITHSVTPKSATVKLSEEVELTVRLDNTGASTAEGLTVKWTLEGSGGFVEHPQCALSDKGKTATCTKVEVQKTTSLPLKVRPTGAGEITVKATVTGDPRYTISPKAPSVGEIKVTGQ